MEKSGNGSIALAIKFIMVSNKKFQELALSFPEAVELPHFENLSFRVNKKIFATLNGKERRGCLKLSEIDQHVFSSFDKTVIYPVPNKWGKQGWTLIELKKVRKDTLLDALTTAYKSIAPKRLLNAFSENE
jgi:hypothetical protein